MFPLGNISSRSICIATARNLPSSSDSEGEAGTALPSPSSPSESEELGLVEEELELESPRLGRPTRPPDCSVDEDLLTLTRTFFLLEVRRFTSRFLCDCGCFVEWRRVL